MWGSFNKLLAETLTEESANFVASRKRFWKAILAYESAWLVLALLYFFVWIPYRIRQFNAVFDYFPKEHIKNNEDFEAFFN
jgi:cyanate permease